MLLCDQCWQLHTCCFPSCCWVLGIRIEVEKVGASWKYVKQKKCRKTRKQLPFCQPDPCLFKAPYKPRGMKHRHHWNIQSTLKSFYGWVSETHAIPTKNRIRYRNAHRLVMNESFGGVISTHPHNTAFEMMRLSSTFFIDVEDIHPRTRSYITVYTIRESIFPPKRF